MAKNKVVKASAPVDGKSFWQSKGIWAGVATFTIALASWYFGEASPVVSALVAISAAFGIWGRVDAKAPVKF